MCDYFWLRGQCYFCIYCINGVGGDVCYGVDGGGFEKRCWVQEDECVLCVVD